MTNKQEKSQEFKSDAVTFTVERQPECMVECKVKASTEVVKKAHKSAIRSVSKEVSLPGFRKGRAPDHLIIKKFAEPLKERWQKSIADEAFRECQKLAHIPLLSNDAQINFNVEKYSMEDGAELTYSFETEPIIPEVNLSNIELEEVKRETIDGKKLEETFHDIQMFFAEWEKIPETPAKEGDYAVIDVDIIEKEPPQKALTNARFELNKEKMAKWMYDLIIGMKVGVSKEGVSEPDKEASQEEKESTPPRKIRLTLKSLEKPKLPPVDDALAQKMGAKNAKEMRENLEKLLNKQADEHVQKAYREQINAYLLKNYEFELPKTLLQKETQFRIKQLVADPDFQRKLMGMNEEKRKEIVKEIEQQGAQAVRLFYLSRKIIQEQKIPISPHEVHQEVRTPLEAMFSDQTDLYDAKEESQEQRAIAMSRLVLSKTEDFLISKAKIVPPKAKKKEETPPEEKAEKKVAPKKTTPKEKKTPEKKQTKSTKKA